MADIGEYTQTYMVIDTETIKNLLKVKSDGYLFHRERSDLEFKEQFNFAGLAEYLKDFAAFANNQGGYLIFGVGNSPRVASGMSPKSIEMFEKIDEEVISGAINDIFSPSIDWERANVLIDGKNFGVLYAYESKLKPIIAKKDEGKDQIIKSGEIYYRYAGRTQKIEFGELESIINNRVNLQNQQWLDLMSKIGRVGPENAAILDTEKGLIEKNDSNILVLDEELTKKIKFIREGDFSEKKGAITLRLVGDVQPIDRVEVTKVLQTKLTDQYPFSYKQTVDMVRQSLGRVNTNRVNAVIKDNNMKHNKAYCAYNFRNKQQEDRYYTEGFLPSTTPSIYNDAALQFIINELQK